MNNFRIYPQSGFLTPSIIHKSEDANYPAANFFDYSGCEICFHSSNTADLYLVFDFLSATNILALLIADINFTSVTIQGNASDVWSSPSFSQSFTAQKNTIIDRYQILTALTTFNYRYLRIKIPSQSTTDVAAYFRIGNLAIGTSVFEFAQNPSYGYKRKAAKSDPIINKFRSGGREKIQTGDRKIFANSLQFSNRVYTVMSDYWTLDALIDETDLFIFYENLGDTSAAYLCQRDGSVEISDNDLIISTNEFSFVEAD